MSSKLFYCELPEGGSQPKHVAARLGEIYILVQYVHLLLLSDGNICGSYSGTCTVPL